jgi:hypothetical protein
MAETRAVVLPLLEPGRDLVLGSPDGSLLAVDGHARWALALPGTLDSPEQAEQVAALIRTWVARAGEADRQSPPGYTVHATLAAVYEATAVRRGLEQLLGALVPAGPTELMLHFSRPPADWLPVTRWLFRLVERHEQLAGRVWVRGPFGLLDGEVQEVFIGIGCRLGFVIGWGDPAGDRSGRPWREALRALARFGFRVPAVCYIHAGNVREARRLIEEALEANEHSGFALPLVFHHPDYTFGPGQPPPPPAGAYAELLAHCYRDYPDYDDLFVPVADLAGLMGGPSWCGPHGVPARVQVLAGREGPGVFRQIPALARPWLGWEGLASTDPGGLVARLLEFYRGQFAWEANPFCGGCGWRWLCGGQDAWPGGPAAPQAALEAGCAYRKLFLESFAWQKWREAAALAGVSPG